MKQQQSTKIFLLSYEKIITNVRTWFKRPRKPLVDVFPQAFFLKVKMRCFNSMNLWVYRNWSCHAMCHQRSYQIELKPDNQNPQNNMIASFSFVSMVKLFTSTGRDFDSMIKFNTSMGREYCEWIVCGTEVAFQHKAGWRHTFLSFLPRLASCSQQFTPYGSIFA